MELHVGKQSRSIPEAWIGRWQFLIDYREEIGTEVQWNYTTISAVDRWIELNESIDSVAERRSKKFPPIDPSYLLDLRTKDWPYDRKWIPLSDVYETVEFMNPVNDNYLLYVVIDDALSEQRRKQMYYRLGRYVIANQVNACRPNDGTVAKSFDIVSYKSPEAIPDDYPVSLSVVQSIYAVLGVIRNSYQKRMQRDPYSVEGRHYSVSDVASLDWEEVYRMRPILTDEEVAEVRAKYGRFILPSWYTIMSLYLESPMVKFMAGVAVPRTGDGTSPLYTHGPYSETYQGGVTSWLDLDNPTAVQKLIEVIDSYVDSAEPESLAVLAKGALGLGPLLDNTGYYIVGGRSQNKHVYEAPYFFISVYNSLYLPTGSGGVKEEDYLDVCLYLGNKWGSFWLQSCVKCLVRILEYRKKTKKLDWSDLITSHKKQKSVSIVATRETKRLVLFCEAAMEAIDQIEERAGGMTTFSAPPVLDSFV